MKTTLSRADDHCHRSSLQVSNSASTRWLNRGKCAGWHSGSNYHHLTSYVSMEISSHLFSHTAIDCFRVVRRFPHFNNSLVFLDYVWFCAPLPVRGSLLRLPPAPSITSICWWIVTQCLLRPVGDKSPQFLQTDLQSHPSGQCACVTSCKGERRQQLWVHTYLLATISTLPVEYICGSSFPPDFARGGEESVWDLAVLRAYTLVGVD